MLSLLRLRRKTPVLGPPMAVRRIRLLGDPILRQRCQRVEKPSSAAVRLVADDLRDTLKEAKQKYAMGRALSAPQIGAPVRVVVVDIDGAKQRLVMVNPEITDVGPKDFLVWDDCFSFPDLLVRVTRAMQVTVAFEDLKGRPHTLESEAPMPQLMQPNLHPLPGILPLDPPLAPP